MPKTNIFGIMMRKCSLLLCGILWLSVINQTSLFACLGYHQDYGKAMMEQYLERVEQYEKDKMWGNAIIELLKNSKYYPPNDHTIDQIENIKRRIINRIHLNICLLPNDRNYQGEVYITQEIYKRILSQVPDTLNIIYWENLKDASPILANILENGSTEERARSKGIDQLIFVKLINSEIRTQSIERAMTQIYIKDSFKRENPEWMKLQAELDQIKKRLQEKRAMQKLANSTGDSLTRLQSSIIREDAESDMYTALGELLAESKFTTENVFDYWPYKIITKRRQGLLAISYRIIDFITTEIITSNSCKKNVFAEDDIIENPNPYIGVIDHPLNLPSEHELRESGFNELLPEMVEKILSDISMQESKKRYFEAKQYEQSNLNDNAAEKLVDYLFLQRKANLYIDNSAKKFLWEKKGFDIELLKPVIGKKSP